MTEFRLPDSPDKADLLVHCDWLEEHGMISYRDLIDSLRPAHVQNELEFDCYALIGWGIFDMKCKDLDSLEVTASVPHRLFLKMEGHLETRDKKSKEDYIWWTYPTLGKAWEAIADALNS